MAADEHTTLVVGYATSRAAVLAASELAHRVQTSMHVVWPWSWGPVAGVPALDPVGATVQPDAGLDEDSLAAAAETERKRVADLLAGSPVAWTYATAGGPAAPWLGVGIDVHIDAGGHGLTASPRRPERRRRLRRLTGMSSRRWTAAMRLR